MKQDKNNNSRDQQDKGKVVTAHLKIGESSEWKLFRFDKMTVNCF